MFIIRNLTISNILLNDLGGITIKASSDYNLNEEYINDIGNSQDLKNNITLGNIIILDNNGNQLSQTRSLNVQDNLSNTLPSFIVQSDGVDVSNTPHDTLNFVDNFTVLNTGSSADITSLPNTELFLSVIDNQEILSFSDPNRSNKILSIEKVQFLFVGYNIDTGVWLWNSYDNYSANDGFIMPMNGTIVSVSAYTRSTGGRAGEYNIFVGEVDQGIIVTLQGRGAQVKVDNTLNIDINKGEKLRFRNTFISGDSNGNQKQSSFMVYVRWRV